MRLGKKKEKERETESKSQQVEGVTRLICSTKTHTMPLKGKTFCLKNLIFVNLKLYAKYSRMRIT